MGSTHHPGNQREVQVRVRAIALPWSEPSIGTSPALLSVAQHDHPVCRRKTSSIR